MMGRNGQRIQRFGQGVKNSFLALGKRIRDPFGLNPVLNSAFKAGFDDFARRASIHRVRESARINEVPYSQSAWQAHLESHYGAENVTRNSTPRQAFEPDIGQLNYLYYNGTSRPRLFGATPNSIYTHIKNNRAVQNAIYDNNGMVIGHVDFKNHGGLAVSGHGHKFSIPGDPSSGHGRGAIHYLPTDLPSEWLRLPSGILPHTSLFR